MSVTDTQNTALDFFFNIIKWVFNDFLLRVKLLDIPVLWYFIGLTILGVLIAGLINTTQAGIVTSIKMNKKIKKKKNKQKNKKSNKKGN